MPIPLVAIAAAYAAGGQLVAHSAGGMIMSVGGSYVAGTYLSTAAITALWTGSITLAGAGAVALSGAASAAIGGAGIFGTTLGSTGIIGWLMSAGIISSTPIWLPILIGTGIAGLGAATFKFFTLSKKLKATPQGEEAHFTASEAKAVGALILWLAKRQKPSADA
jgi:hypothetical protein